MKTPFICKTSVIKEDLRKKHLTCIQFKNDSILQNIQRGKLLAVIIICFEAIFLVIDIISWILKVNDAFSYDSYLAMYSLMIILNLLYLFLINSFNRNKITLNAINTCFVVYITLVMVWGSVISLMDQKLYGNLMSFMINMIVCSTIYLFDAKVMSIPFISSTLILAVGLPFFQKSSNILIGHYVNLLVFIVVSWIVSRIVYRNYCDNYIIKELMNDSKLQLEKEMQEKRIINEKLAIANAQLQKLALVDELTGLSNRRNFRKFIDRVFENSISDLDVSVIMIDIDNFKQYNDAFGHEHGDQALIAIAKQIDSMVESSDQIAVRWGGEEFLYTTFNKSKVSILETAEKLRSKVIDLKIPTSDSSISPYITISLGVCSGTISNAANISEIINISDQALYMAKNSGRNRVAFLDCNKKVGE